MHVGFARPASLLFMLVAFVFAFPAASPAKQPSAQAMYQKAAAKLERLQKNPKKRRYRHLWEACIADLDKVISRYPGSTYASKALFAKAEAYSSLYRISRRGSDLDTAIEDYGRCAQGPPGSDEAALARRRIKALTGVDVKEKSPDTPETAAPAKTTLVNTTPPKTADAEAAPPETASPAITAKAGGPVNVVNIRRWSSPGGTRVVVDLDGKTSVRSGRMKRPDRLVFDISRARIGSPLKDAPVTIDDGVIKTARASQYKKDTVRVVLDLAAQADYRTLLLPNPHRLVIDVTVKTLARGSGHGRIITLRSVRQGEAPPTLSAQAEATPKPSIALVAPAAQETAPEPATTQATAPAPSEAGQQTIPAAVPAQPAEPAPAQAAPAAPTASVAPPAATIVIDPGHGGKDTGAIGKGGLLEKDVVLDIGLRLRELIKKDLDCRVVMTRESDVFIDLDQRPVTQKDADLFISIHANASPDRSARGIETYLLNTTKDRNIMELAARENMMDMDKMGDTAVILKDLVLDSKREESLRLAHVVQACLVGDLQKFNGSLNDKGVKQGPFLVLYGAEMPSVLTEVGFISNPDEEALLGSPDYRQDIAQALFDGIRRYVLSSKVAKAP